MSCDLTNATDVRIKYRKPDATEGYWTAAIYTPLTGVIYYDIKVNDIPAADYGTWMLWAWATFTDGRTTMGEAVHKKFHQEPA